MGGMIGGGMTVLRDYHTGYSLMSAKLRRAAFRRELEDLRSPYAAARKALAARYGTRWLSDYEQWCCDSEAISLDNASAIAKEVLAILNHPPMLKSEQETYTKPIAAEKKQKTFGKAVQSPSATDRSGGTAKGESPHSSSWFGSRSPGKSSRLKKGEPAPFKQHPNDVESNRKDANMVQDDMNRDLQQSVAIPDPLTAQETLNIAQAAEISHSTRLTAEQRYNEEEKTIQKSAEILRIRLDEGKGEPGIRCIARLDETKATDDAKKIYEICRKDPFISNAAMINSIAIAHRREAYPVSTSWIGWFNDIMHCNATNTTHSKTSQRQHDSKES